MKRINPLSWFKSHAGRFDPESMRSFAEAYWRTLLIAGAIISIVVLVYAWEQFSIIQKERSTEGVSGASTAQKNIDRDQLQATLDEFTARAARFKALGASKEAISDPSR